MKIPNPLEYPLYSIAGVILAIGLGYQAFLTVDERMLSRREADAKVVAKEYRPTSQGTYTTKVGNTVRSYPITLPDAYLVTIEIGGVRGQGEIPRGDYASVKEGDPVRVTYSQKRLRKDLIIHAIAKLGGGG